MICPICKQEPEFVQGKCLRCFINNDERFKLWYPRTWKRLNGVKNDKANTGRS